MGESRHLNDRDKYKDNNRSTVVSRAIDGIRMSIDMTVLGKIAKLRTNAKNSNSLLSTLMQWCNTMLSSEGRVVDLFHQGGMFITNVQECFYTGGVGYHLIYID